MRKEVIQIRCSFAEKANWQNAAANQNLELSAWVRHLLNNATHSSLDPQPNQAAGKPLDQ